MRRGPRGRRAKLQGRRFTTAPQLLANSSTGVDLAATRAAAPSGDPLRRPRTQRAEQPTQLGPLGPTELGDIAMTQHLGRARDGRDRMRLASLAVAIPVAEVGLGDAADRLALGGSLRRLAAEPGAEDHVVRVDLVDVGAQGRPTRPIDPARCRRHRAAATAVKNACERSRVTPTPALRRARANAASSSVASCDPTERTGDAVMTPAACRATTGRARRPRDTSAPHPRWSPPSRDRARRHRGCAGPTPSRGSPRRRAA